MKIVKRTDNFRILTNGKLYKIQQRMSIFSIFFWWADIEVSTELLFATGRQVRVNSRKYFDEQWEARRVIQKMKLDKTLEKFKEHNGTKWIVTATM